MIKVNIKKLISTLLSVILLFCAFVSIEAKATPPSETISRDTLVTAVVQGETTGGTTITLTPDGKLVETKIVTYNEPEPIPIITINLVDKGITTLLDFILPRTGGIATKSIITTGSLTLCLLGMFFCFATLKKNKKEEAQDLKKISKQ